MDTQLRKNEFQEESHSFEYDINESIQEFIDNKHLSSFDEKSSSFDHKLDKLILYEDLFESDSNTNSSKTSLDFIPDDPAHDSIDLVASEKSYNLPDQDIKVANLRTEDRPTDYSDKSLIEGSYPPLKVQPNPKTVKCNECGKLVLKSSLKIHARSHSGEKPFKCDVCNKTFTVKCNLRHHLLTHNSVRPIQCPDCTLRFKTEHLMQVHLKSVHSEVKPFSCEKCNVKFKLKRNLQVHIMKIHTSEKPYKCESCDYSTVHKSCLETHFWTHTNIKRFHCEVCDKFFTQRAKLQDHVNIHNNIRPFTCKHCNKAFNRKDNLKVHLRSHLGTKPYKCDVCSKLFSSSQGLNYHLKKQNHKRSEGENKQWDEVAMKPNMLSVQSMTPYTTIQQKKTKCLP